MSEQNARRTVRTGEFYLVYTSGGVVDAVAFRLSHETVLGCALQKRGTSVTRINKHKEDTNAGTGVALGR